MRSLGSLSLQLVLPAPGAGSLLRGAHAPDRRGVHQNPGLWIPPDDRLAQNRGACGQSQADPSSDAAHGPGGDLSQALPVEEEQGPRDLPLSSEECGHYPTESGLQHGYHLHPSKEGLCLSHGHYRLVLAVCPGLGGLGDHGCGILLLHALPGPDEGRSRDLQHGPGIPIYRQSVHRSSESPSHPDQHGRTGSGTGQCLRGTPLEVG